MFKRYLSSSLSHYYLILFISKKLCALPKKYLFLKFIFCFFKTHKKLQLNLFNEIKIIVISKLDLLNLFSINLKEV